MKLLLKQEYREVEGLLRDFYSIDKPLKKYSKCIQEITTFFNKNPYKDFLHIFYFKRNQYKNRYPNNSDLFIYLSQILYVQQPTLYIIRKEIIYKSAMVFYKNGLL